MKSLLLIALSGIAAVAARGETVEAAIIAAMELSQDPNYSWSCTVIDDAQTYTVMGKTQQDGYTWQRQPMPKVVARRLGREAGWELESIFNGWSRYVILTNGGWRRLDELPKTHPSWNEEWYYVASPTLRTPDMPADEAQLDAFGLPPSIYLPVIRAQEDEPDGPYSNAQFALSLPHEELAIIVSSHAEMQVEGNVATGTLTDHGAQLLLVHPGHEYIQPVVATGRFTLWMNSGRVNKFMVELAGIVVVDRKPVYVRQKACTTVESVGTTVVNVPPDARQRLDG